MDKLLIDGILNRSKNVNWNVTKSSSYDPKCIPSFILFPTNESLFLSIHDSHGNSYEHYHDFFEINYVIKGTPIGVINGEDITLNPGNLLLMNPNAIHYFKKYKDGADCIINIAVPTETFRRAIFIPLLSDPQLNAFFVRYQVESIRQSSFLILNTIDEDRERVIELLVKEYIESKNYNSVIIDSLITILFGLIFRQNGASCNNKESYKNEIINYIYKNNLTCSLNLLSKKFNYHPKYLSALIKKHTGVSFRKLLVKIRLQNSIQFLVHSKKTLEEIVELIGYQDKSSFYQSFKKEFGITPGEYRSKYFKQEI